MMASPGIIQVLTEVRKLINIRLWLTVLRAGLAPVPRARQEVDVSLSKWNNLRPGDIHLR